MMAKTSLPPGFRFHPTDVELVWYYLKRKVMGKPFRFEVIAEIELYKFAPWDLPDKSCLKSKDLEWYFFCPRDRKYANGSRTNRATDIGYWKTTGRDRCIVHSSRMVGTKKTLIFHLGKAPHGKRTDWVMYEYRLEDKELTNAGFSQDAYVLCKIFQKSGLGPKNGEQYGAPFDEEEWEDDIGIELSGSISCVLSSPVPFDDHDTLEKTVLPESMAFGVDEGSPLPFFPEEDEGLMHQLLAALSESPHTFEDAYGETSDAVIQTRGTNTVSSVDLDGIYDGLGDLSGQSEFKTPDNCMGMLNNEYGLQAMEVGDELYLKLDEMQYLLNNDPSELLMPDDLLSHDPFEAQADASLEQKNRQAEPELDYMTHSVPHAGDSGDICSSHDLCESLLNNFFCDSDPTTTAFSPHR